MVYHFGSLIQALKTFVRGIAQPGEKPLFTVSPLGVFAANLIGYGASILTFQLFWSLHLYPLMLLSVLLGQAAAWSLYMVEHHAVHGAISRENWINRWVAEVASVVGLTIDPDKYKPRHNRDHHDPRKLATKDDPDFRFLGYWGFVPGKSVDYYYRQLFTTLVNPIYYAENFYSRLVMNLLAAPLLHRLLVLAWWGSVFLIAFSYNLWAGLAGYLAIAIFGYGISALLQTLTEHRWGFQGDPAQKTFPRLLPIDEYPGMFLVYLYWRTSVLGTDLAQHQIHHRKPKNFAWPMVAYSEEAQSDRQIAILGIKAHFEETFKALSQGKTL